MNRRTFLAQMAGGASTVLLSACGGSKGSPAAEASGSAPSVTVVPPAAPPPVAAPPPPPPGQAINLAEAELAAQFDPLFKGFSASSQFDAVFSVTSADELAAALAKTRSTASGSYAIKQKVQIVCNWTGTSMLSAGAAAILDASGFHSRTDGHLDNGGGIYVVAAAGQRPGLANQVNLNGTRGIHFEGIGFFRQLVGTERAETAYGVHIASNNTFPAKPVVLFSHCSFGARSNDPALPFTQWVSAISTIGLPDYVGLFGCRFNGHQSIAKLAVRYCRIDRCDFQANLQDSVDLFGHTVEAGYYAYAWISRCTFRNAGDEIENRSEHMGAIQTGTSRDRHLGYRCLYTDLIVHSSHSYAGDPGMGGGTSGFYSDDHLTADNQFVVRRCIVLVSSPHGFTFSSPNATRPSFVDQCTFMRCGRVPSNLPGDPNPAQDFGVGIAGAAPAGGPWLTVTRSIGMDVRSNQADGSQLQLIIADPRNRPGIAPQHRPEAVFKGRDFTRGGPAANYIAGKFGYILPNERGSQAQFVADIWANFEPVSGLAGNGAPDPRPLDWSL